MVPYAMSSGEVVLSLACIGNRVYTDLGDNGGDVAIPGASLASTMDKLDAIVSANEALEGFYRQRRVDVQTRI